jgi:hypothetical protein
MQDRNKGGHSEQQQQGGGGYQERGQQDLAKRRQQLERRSSDRETRRPFLEQDGGQGRGGTQQQRTNNRRPSGGQERRGAATWEQQLRGGSGGHGHSPGLQQADTRGHPTSKERGVGEGQVRRRQNSSTLDSSGGFKGRDSFSWDPNSVTNKKYDKNKYMVSHATKDFTFTYHAGLRIQPNPHPPSGNLLRPYLWI